MTVKTVETEDLGEYDLLTAARYAGASKKSKNFDGENVETVETEKLTELTE